MAQQHAEQGDMQKSAAVLRRYYNTQTLEHIVMGQPFCAPPLANER